MASRVNTKFVVILIVAVVAMLGMLFAAYSVVYKSADDLASKGDQFFAAGDYDQARLLYSKAVNKDPTIVENIEKWIESIEHWTPETETAYYDAFRSDYMGAITQAARVQRTNIDAYKREFDVQMDLLNRRYTRNSADRLIARTTEILGNFDGVPGVDPSWPSLRGYRGVAWQRIGSNGGVIDDEQLDLVTEDLRAAVEADPSNEAYTASLMRWLVYVAQARATDANEESVIGSRREAIQVGNAHLETYPDSPLVLLTVIAIEMEVARAIAIEGFGELERAEKSLEAFSGYMNHLDEAHALLMRVSTDKISMNVLANLQIIEKLVDPESVYSRSAEVLDRVVSANPTSPDFLLSLARMKSTLGDVDASAEAYQTVIDLPIPPVSAEGVSLFNGQREALISISAIWLDELERVQSAEETTQEEIDSLINRAKQSRDVYAGRVTEDDTPLLLINGRIAFMEDNAEEALRLFRQYNSQTQNSSTTGLWYEAVAARELNQLGTARTALTNLIMIKPHSLRGLAALGEVEVRLKQYTFARERFNQMLKYSPDNRVAREGITNLNVLEDPSLIDNPAIALVLTARQAREGNDQEPGDLSKAIQILRDGIAATGYAEEPTVELVSMLMDRDDLVGARAVADQAAAANPENESILKLQTALQNDDEVDILVAMIEQNQPDRAEQLISIANIAFTRERYELLDSCLAELETLAPDDKRRIDLAFVRALLLEDIDRARTLAQKAAQLNIDSVGGLTYEARVASVFSAGQEGHIRAVQLLEQATSTGTADAAVYRMLGLEESRIGRIEASIKSFEQALNIRPDDQTSIIEFVQVLIQANRYDDALDVARRYQRYAIENPQFMALWLSLEANAGGEEGRAFAIKQREMYLQLDPNNQANNFELARLYIQDRRWNESKSLIDALIASDDSLQNAELLARWYFEQGRVGNQNGLALARQVYIDYIDRYKADIDATPFIALSQFMLDRGRPDLAVQAATNAIELEDPETLEGTKLMADLYMLLNQYANAAEAYRKVVDAGADPNNLYRMRLVDMYIRTKQFQLAREQFDVLDTENAESMIAMLQNAEIEEGLGNSQTAAEMLDRAVAKYSDNPLVYIKRAEYLTGSDENLTDLLADVDAALQINPNDWRAFRVRAAAYFAVDQREDALRDLMRAVRLNPKLDQALFGIVNELIIDGRNSEAFDFAVEIVEQRQRDASLIDSLGQLFSSRNDWEYATQFYNLAWEVQRSPRAGATLIDAIVRTRNPDTSLANSVINDLTEIAGDINTSPGLLAAQALVLQARDRDELALQQLTKAFDLSTNSDDMLIQWSGNISRFFENQSMQDQISYIETLKRRNPNPEVMNWLDLFIAQRLLRVGSQTDLALSVFERLLAADHQKEVQRIAYQSLGTSEYTQGDYARAAEVWSAGAELFPDDWEMSNNLAYVLSAELGEHDRALLLAQNAISMNPDRSEPYDTLGTIYIAIGEYDKARETLQEGMRYALSVRSRATLVLAQIKLDLAMGKKDEAKSKLLDIRSLMRSMPTRDTGLEQQLDDAELEIDSDG